MKPLVGGRSTSEREQDLLAVAFLASLDVFADVGAARQQIGRDTVVLVGCRRACVSEVGTGVTSRALIREDIDKGNVDNVDIRALADLYESFLVWSLTLQARLE